MPIVAVVLLLGGLGWGYAGYVELSRLENHDANIQCGEDKSA